MPDSRIENKWGDNCSVGQMVLAVLAAVIAVGIAWGVLQSRVANAESQVARLTSDHDAIVTLVVNVDRIKMDLSDIKTDIKLLLGRREVVAGE